MTIPFAVLRVASGRSKYSDWTEIPRPQTGHPLLVAMEQAPRTHALLVPDVIAKRGPRILTAEELVRNGYPSNPDPEAIYAVFDVEPDSFYHGWKWDFTRLLGKKVGLASAEPFAVSLVDVLSAHRL